MILRELKELVQTETRVATDDQKLILGGQILSDEEGTLASMCGSILEAAQAASETLELTLVTEQRRTVEATADTPMTIQAHGGERPFHPPPGCPTSGDYDNESIHHWANHSSCGTFVTLALPATLVDILEVSATVVAKDQGWGGTGDAGAVVVLLGPDGEERGYSAQSLTSHDETVLEWRMTPESHGGSFPAKSGEEYCGSVCGSGEGLSLALRVFTPDWGGWSVTGVSATLRATIVG